MNRRRAADLTPYELLATVARTGSIGACARRYGISQPAVSARIRALEDDLGFRVLHRAARGARPTEHGTLVVEWAGPALAAAKALDEAIEALRSAHHGHVRIAASTTIAEYLLPRWLPALRRRRPELTVSLRARNSAATAGAVREGTCDIGFVEGWDAPAGVDSRVVGEDRLVVVVAPGHPWARSGRPVPPELLARTALVMREPGSGTRSVLEHALAAGGYDPPVEPAIELSSTTAIKNAVAEGNGPAVVSSLAVAAELADGQLVALDVAGLPLTRRLRAIWARGHRLAGPARELLAIAGARR